MTFFFFLIQYFDSQDHVGLRRNGDKRFIKMQQCYIYEITR